MCEYLCMCMACLRAYDFESFISCSDREPYPHEKCSIVVVAVAEVIKYEIDAAQLDC